MLLQYKNAMICRGGGAIGGTMARSIAREGATVVVAGRTLDKLEHVAREVSAAGGIAETVVVDALDEKAVEESFDAIAGNVGSIDIAVNPSDSRTCKACRPPSCPAGRHQADRRRHPGELHHGNAAARHMSSRARV